MKTKKTITEITHDDLVDILSTALYGCDFLGADYDSEFYDALPDEKKEGDCYEDKMADILLNGGKIRVVDFYAEGEVYGNGKLDKNDENGIYFLTLEDFIKAMESEEGWKYAEELLINEDGDYFTANNLLQIAMFGEVVYG